MHIPLIFRHPARIPAGRVFEGRTCNYDFLPSLLEHLGIDAQLPPGHPELPGCSYAEHLTGDGHEWNDEEFFHEFETVRTVRSESWKYTWRFADGPDELYDMIDDPGERVNRAADPSCAAVVAEHRARIERFFGRYADPKWDLWKAGSTKAGRLVA